MAITDPYRWLEDQNSPRTRKWLEEQAAYTRAYLDAIPGRERIRKRVEQLLSVEVVSDVWKVGDRYFYSKRLAHSEQPVIMIREGQAGREMVLVDPLNKDASATTAVRILAISRNGDLLAYATSYGGNPFHTTEFFDVRKQRTLTDRLSLGIGYGLVFSSDGKGFYYSHQFAESLRPHCRSTYWHEFGSKAFKDTEVFVAGEDPRLSLTLFGSADGRFLAYWVVRDDTQTYSVYVQDMSSGKPARKILEQNGSIFWPCFKGFRLFALTDWEAPNLRVLAFDLCDCTHDHWVEVVPESQHRINNFCLAGDCVYVVRVKGLLNELEAFEQSGQQRSNVSCPSQGTVQLFRHPTESDCLFYRFSSFNQAPVIFSWDATATKPQKWAEMQVPWDPSLLEVEQARYKSKDGTEIPISLVSKKGCRTSRGLPTFLTGYGGFGSSRGAQFNFYSAFLIEHGFLFAVANLRGGGEFGAEWHRAGKRHNRQNAFDDFIAAAEWLIAEGLAIPEKIAIGGMSNAGLLVGAALTQRPDLFGVVVCMAPLLDMLRYHISDPHCRNEFGCSENEEDFQHLLAYSPYHRVENDATYPSVLIVSGDLDKTCNPMHARKMTARLQATTNSRHPALLDYRPTWGHNPAQPLTRRIDALTDRLGFMCHELGVNI